MVYHGGLYGGVAVIGLVHAGIVFRRVLFFLLFFFPYLSGEQGCFGGLAERPDIDEYACDVGCDIVCVDDDIIRVFPCGGGWVPYGLVGVKVHVAVAVHGEPFPFRVDGGPDEVAVGDVLSGRSGDERVLSMTCFPRGRDSAASG